MAKIAERLKKALEIRDITQSELSRKTGIGKSSISTYLTGEYEPKQRNIYKMALALNVNEAWLMGADVPMDRQEATSTHIENPIAANIVPFPPKDVAPYVPTHCIPILGRVSAGLPLYAEEHIEGYMYTELNGGAEYFALRVQGDSMNALRINDGDLLIVRRQEEVEDGEIAVVMVNGEDATVKRFYRDGDFVTLMPQSTNPEHQPQRYDLKETRIKVLGKVVRSQINFE